MQSNNRQKILTYVLVLVLIAAGYYYYNLYGGSSITAGVVSTDYSAPVGEDILLLVQKMDRVNIDESVFTSRLFTNLIDSSISVNQEEKYRPNPFAPLGNNTASAQSSGVLFAPNR
jgi:hypothetical protein